MPDAASYTYEDGLVTERLYTRFIVPDDAKEWARFFEDKEAMQYFWPSDKSIQEQSNYWIERQLLRYKENRYGLQTLIHKQTNEFIGQCGLMLQEIDGKQELEVGYHIFKKHWGQGYAPEAARAFLHYGFEHRIASSIISIIDVRNINSQRVADKNGLKREKQIRWLEMDVFVYRMEGPFK